VAFGFIFGFGAGFRSRGVLLILILNAVDDVLANRFGRSEVEGSGAREW